MRVRENRVTRPAKGPNYGNEPDDFLVREPSAEYGKSGLTPFYHDPKSI
jgi:hypothetical protein